jgi:hypothetical protein
LWGGSKEKKNKLGFVGKVCRPLEEGGPGIKNLRDFNMALLGKWVWKIKSEM